MFLSCEFNEGTFLKEEIPCDNTRNYGKFFEEINSKPTNSQWDRKAIRIQFRTQGKKNTCRWSRIRTSYFARRLAKYSISNNSATAARLLKKRIMHSFGVKKVKIVVESCHACQLKWRKKWKVREKEYLSLIQNTHFSFCKTSCKIPYIRQFSLCYSFYVWKKQYRKSKNERRHFGNSFCTKAVKIERTLLW